MADMTTTQGRRSQAGFDLTPPTEEEFRRLVDDLDDEERRVLLDHGTERPFCGIFNEAKEKGTYACRFCGLPLFKSGTKFESGTGWPSFFRPIEGAVETSEDNTFFMKRTEVHCANCGGHLGHVFEDGPKPTGLRYCMNGVAMNFKPAADAA